MRLFHFSSDPDIRVFEPRPVRVPSPRPAGREWLNGPLVWAIDEPHEPLYLFPRDCPRVLLWIGEHTTDEDRIRWWGQRDCRMVAHIESSWWTKLTEAELFRYELPTDSFAPLHDAGMYVSRDRVAPLAVQRISDLPGALERCAVELRLMPSLAPLTPLWSTSLHVSGIRLRNARDWPPARGDEGRVAQPRTSFATASNSPLTKPASRRS